MLRANAELMVPRTVAIDDAVSEWPAAQVVILGAGLDGRAWRMPGLATVDIFEVDHPASQRDKRDRVGELQPLARSLRFVPVDFTGDDLDGPWRRRAMTPRRRRRRGSGRGWCPTSRRWRSRPPLAS